MNFNIQIGISVLGGLYSPDNFAKSITPFTEIITWLEKNQSLRSYIGKCLCGFSVVLLQTGK